MPEPLICQRRPLVQQVEPGEYWWCACGRSKGQPFCDGSHKGTGLQPKKVEITEAGSVAWCMCKHSGDGAFCDGTHGRLAK
jgi:CDGSH-type Zn-finger protein